MSRGRRRLPGRADDVALGARRTARDRAALRLSAHRRIDRRLGGAGRRAARRARADSVTVITAADLQARRSKQSPTRCGSSRPDRDPQRRPRRHHVALPARRRIRTTRSCSSTASARTIFGGGYDFAHLSVADVDRIEVVRGPQSALFGSDAIGARRADRDAPRRRARARRAHRGRQPGTIRASRRTPRAHAGRGPGAAGAEQHAERRVHRDCAGQRRAVSATTTTTCRTSRDARLAAADGADFLVTGNIGRDERGFPGPFGSDPIGAFGGVDRVSRGVNDTRQVGGALQPLRGRRASRQRVEANYTDFSSDFASSFGPSTSGTRRFDGRVQEDIAFCRRPRRIGRRRVPRERGYEQLHHRRGRRARSRSTAASTGSFGELRFARQRSAVRHRRRAAGAHDARRARGRAQRFSPRPAFPDQTINSVNPKIAVSYAGAVRASTSTRVHASAGTGIRPPTRSRSRSPTIPNLKPERSRSVDAGVEQQFAGGALRRRRHGVLQPLRRSDRHRRHGRCRTPASIKTDNISNARARGLELSGDAPPRSVGHASRAATRFSRPRFCRSTGSTESLRRRSTVGDPLDPPAAASGLGRRHLRASAGVDGLRRGDRRVGERSTSSRTSAPSAACFPRQDTPSSTSAHRRPRRAPAVEVFGARAERRRSLVRRSARVSRRSDAAASSESRVAASR